MPMVHIKIFKIPQGVWDIMKEPMWTCDVVQLLAPLCVSTVVM